MGVIRGPRRLARRASITVITATTTLMGFSDGKNQRP